jgi:hypothetical protein
LDRIRSFFKAYANLANAVNGLAGAIEQQRAGYGSNKPPGITATVPSKLL